MNKYFGASLIALLLANPTAWAGGDHMDKSAARSPTAYDTTDETDRETMDRMDMDMDETTDSSSAMTTPSSIPTNDLGPSMDCPSGMSKGDCYKNFRDGSISSQSKTGLEEKTEDGRGPASGPAR